ncbi:unnamed protein product, partial [Mesorhabditis belari]|uniref:G-protein coupled receptors family 1 profile domain-containing protein n=1 Tax=Mesorhabditis belari TaxID=2138241 RepID=A0AAF3F6I2_9BILA
MDSAQFFVQILSGISTLGILSNALVITSIFLRREATFRRHRPYFVIGSSFALLFSILTQLLIPIHFFDEKSVHIHFWTNISELIDNENLIILYKLWLLILHGQWFALPVDVLYNYCILCKKPLPPWASISFYLYIGISLSPLIICEFYQPILHFDSAYHTRQSLVITKVDQQILLIGLGFPFGGSLFLLIWCYYNVHRHLEEIIRKRNRLMVRTNELKSRIGWMIGWQIIGPVFLVVFPFTVTYLLLIFSPHLLLDYWISMPTLFPATLPFTQALIMFYYICPPTLLCRKRLTPIDLTKSLHTQQTQSFQISTVTRSKMARGTAPSTVYKSMQLY